MTFHVVHPNEGEPARPGHRLGKRETHQQRADQAGPLGGGHAVQVGWVHPGLRQRPMGQRANGFDVGPRRHLGHHPPETLVQFDLR